MAGEIETELTAATKFKPPKGGFKDRQDLLGALAKSAHKLDDDSFDELTDEAADWVNNAIKALNARGEIPEPDGEAPEEGDEEADEEQVDEKQETKAAEEAEAEAEAEAEEAAQETRKPPKAVKPAKAPKVTEPAPLPRTKEMAAIKTRYDNVTGEKDRFGVMIGTKTHDAVLMYEKGATSKQIQEALGEGPAKSGGRFYNVLKKLSMDGHLVERDGEGVFKLTHKDDLPGKEPAAPRATKQTRLPLKKSKKK